MMESDDERVSEHRWRNRAVYLVLAVVFGVFVARLFSMQVLDHTTYVVQAEDNRTRTISVPTDRGLIYDRNGIVLASNIPTYNVSIIPANLPDDEGAVEAIYRSLSTLTGVPVSNGVVNDQTAKNFTPCQTDLGITEIVYIGDSLAPYSPVAIKCDVSRDVALAVTENQQNWPGVEIEVVPVRDYPTGSLTSDVIGYLGPIPAAQEQNYVAQGFVASRDKVGYAGVELTQQGILGGKNGQREVEVDSAGQILRDLQPPVAPVPGDNLTLSIDVRLQQIAQTALVNTINYWNQRYNETRITQGVVIAMNPKTGEILSMVSYPSYENNRMARVIPADYWAQLNQDPTHPLLNHAISGEFPPGSVFKLAPSIGALNEAVVTPDQKLEDLGKITITEKFSANDPGHPRNFYGYNRNGFGMVDFLRGLALSDDIYFYKIGGGYGTEVPQGLGIWRLGDYAKALGYGRASGIELPGEATGLVPDPTWKRLTMGENWSTGDTYIATIGQGYVLSTPMQVLLSAATVAENGKLIQPTLIKQVTSPQGSILSSLQTKTVWDITQQPLINVYDQNSKTTGQMKTVAPWVIQEVQQGMRLVVDSPEGTAHAVFNGMVVPSAGKTGTAEYCDDAAQKQNLCVPEQWPTHAWYVGYAPYDNPEIAVVAFVYHGGEGATVAAPIVRQVMEGYFNLKAIDTGVQK
jgi:penicillin-binding protein 2